MFYIFHDYMNNEYALFTDKTKLTKFIDEYKQYWMHRIEYEVTENDDYEVIPVYRTDPPIWEICPDG